MKKMIKIFMIISILNMNIFNIYANNDLNVEEPITYNMRSTSADPTIKQKIIATLMAYWAMINNYATDLVLNGVDDLYRAFENVVFLNQLYNDAQQKIFEDVADNIILENGTDIEEIVIDYDTANQLQNAFADSNYYSPKVYTDISFNTSYNESLGAYKVSLNNYDTFYVNYVLGEVSCTSNSRCYLFQQNESDLSSYGNMYFSHYYKLNGYNDLYSVYDMTNTNYIKLTQTYDLTLNPLRLESVEVGFYPFKFFTDFVGQGNTNEGHTTYTGTIDDNTLIFGLKARFNHPFTLALGNFEPHSTFIIPISTAKKKLLDIDYYSNYITLSSYDNTLIEGSVSSNITDTLDSFTEDKTITIPLNTTADSNFMTEDEVKAYINSLISSGDLVLPDDDTNEEDGGTVADPEQDSIFDLLKSWGNSILSLPGKLDNIFDKVKDLPKDIVDSLVGVFIPSKNYFENAFDDVIEAWNFKFPEIDTSLFGTFFNSLTGRSEPPQWYLPIPEELHDYTGTDKALIIDFSWFDKYRALLHSILSLFIVVSFLQRLPDKLEGMGHSSDYKSWGE